LRPDEAGHRTFRPAWERSLASNVSPGMARKLRCCRSDQSAGSHRRMPNSMLDRPILPMDDCHFNDITLVPVGRGPKVHATRLMLRDSHGHRPSKIRCPKSPRSRSTCASRSIGPAARQALFSLNACVIVEGASSACQPSLQGVRRADLQGRLDGGWPIAVTLPRDLLVGDGSSVSSNRVHPCSL
jgi:hypothetical protein